MEESEGRKSSHKGKITVTSPSVLAAILDTDLQDVHRFVQAVSSRNASRTANGELNSLDRPLRDSLESIELENAGNGQDMVGINTRTKSSGLKREFSTSSLSKPPKAYRAPKPPRPQHIVERNKGNLGKRVPGRSYAQMHAIKAKTKVDNAPKRHENTKEEPDENLSDTPVGPRTESVQEWHSDVHHNIKFKDRDELGKDLDHVQQNSHRSNLSLEGLKDVSLDQESILLNNGYLESTNNTYQNHGSLIPGNYLNKNARPSFNNAELTYAKQFPYAHKLESHNVGGYYSVLGDLHQSHVMTKDVLQDYSNQLSTQSAPPEMYGNRRPLVTDTRYLQDQDITSSPLSYGYYRSPSGRDKIPESILSRKFSSEPYLTSYSNSHTLQTGPNMGRNSKTSGSYSSLRQPFEYKPYTLKDYRNFMGARVERLAGGLGPNVDTDDYKGKMEKVSKQREYATMLRAQHASMRKKPLGKEPLPPAKPPKLKEADIKRQAALNYAKNVPKPKQVASRGQNNGHSAGRTIGEKRQEDKDITVLELLKMRHEREKSEIDAIRKELASKLRL